MLIEMLDTTIRKALEDRYEGWELVEILDIPIEEVISSFEDILLDRLQEVLEIAGLEDLLNTDYESDYNNDK